ncbi:MAG TPA: ABC transporter permease [Acidimicrobiales bacterium]|nr:ABC transporter permease [Acidimicrobiales bacterium]
MATLVAAGVFTQLVLPGSSGAHSRGAPAAILFTGVVLGLVNSLTAAGLILVYRTSRVINFAQTALGVLGATFVFDMVQLTKVPFVIVLPIGLALAALAGAVFELLLVRRFFYASRLVLTVATIAAASVLATFSPALVRALPFIPYSHASLAEASGAASVRNFLPLAGFTFHLGSLRLAFGFPEVFAIDASIVALLLVGAFFRYTRAGIAVRGLAENAERASLLGVSVGAMSMIVWVIAGLLGGTSAILTGAILVPSQVRGFAPGLLLAALVAAVVARFRSLPIAVFVSIVLGVITQAAQWSLRDDLPLVTVGMFIVILVALLLQRRADGRSEDGAGVGWQAVDEQRPIPKELASIGSVRAARIALVALGAAIVVAYPFLVGTASVVLGGNVALTTIIILSLVVLTGWSGQVSLGHYGLAAVGAAVAAALTAKVGVPFWISIFVAAAVAGGVAILVGLPALRIRGLFLAVTTLAFGLAITGVLFNDRYFGWMLAKDVKRPTLVLLNFEDERSMYYLCVAALALAIVIVVNLRRSRLGRTLIALRENEANVQAFGIAVVRTKLTAFAISGALAGFAGAVFAFQQRGIVANSFVATRNVDVFLYAVFGGVSSVGGALIGSLWYNVTAYFNFRDPLLSTIFKSSGQIFVLLLLFVAPGGMISLLNRVRDGVLRIVAQRRQIVVPSLFADYDADALERKLIPLAPASDLEGLATLAPGERFALRSELYHGHGERIADKLRPPKPTVEAAVIGAAAESLQDRGATVDVIDAFGEGGVRD